MIEFNIKIDRWTVIEPLEQELKNLTLLMLKNIGIKVYAPTEEQDFSYPYLYFDGSAVYDTQVLITVNWQELSIKRLWQEIGKIKENGHTKQ